MDNYTSAIELRCLQMAGRPLKREVAVRTTSVLLGCSALVAGGAALGFWLSAMLF